MCRGVEGGVHIVHHWRGIAVVVREDWVEERGLGRLCVGGVLGIVTHQLVCGHILIVFVHGSDSHRDLFLTVASGAGHCYTMDS